MKSIKKISLMLAAIFTFGGVAMAENAREGRKNMDPKARAEKITEHMVKEYNLTDTQKQQLLDLNQTFTEKMGERPAPLRHHGKKGRPGEMAKAPKDKKDSDIAKPRREKKDGETARADRGERKGRPEAPKKLSTEEREKMRQEMKETRDNYNAQLQKIMNADQYQAYAKKQAEREQKRQERGEKMKENRNKRQAPQKDNKEA